MGQNEEKHSLTQQDIERHLQSALAAATPNVWSKLDLRVPQDKPENPGISVLRRRRRFDGWKIAAACLCLAALGKTYHYECLQVASVVGIDVNPSLEISLNRLDRVLKAEALNPDGEALLDGSLKGKTLEMAVEEVVDSLVQNGYFAGENQEQAILVSTSGKSKKAAEAVKQAISQQQVDAVVYDQTLQVTKELEALAEMYQVSVGKAEFIDRLVQENEVLNQDTQAAYERMMNRPMEALTQEITQNAYSLSTQITVIESGTPENVPGAKDQDGEENRVSDRKKETVEDTSAKEEQPGKEKCRIEEDTKKNRDNRTETEKEKPVTESSDKKESEKAESEKKEADKMKSHNEEFEKKESEKTESGQEDAKKKETKRETNQHESGTDGQKINGPDGGERMPADSIRTDNDEEKSAADDAGDGSVEEPAGETKEATSSTAGAEESIEAAEDALTLPLADKDGTEGELYTGDGKWFREGEILKDAGQNAEENADTSDDAEDTEPMTETGRAEEAERMSDAEPAEKAEPTAEEAESAEKAESSEDAEQSRHEERLENAEVPEYAGTLENRELPEDETAAEADRDILIRETEEKQEPDKASKEKEPDKASEDKESEEEELSESDENEPDEDDDFPSEYRNKTGSRIIRLENREMEDEEDTGDEYVTYKQIFSHGTMITIKVDPPAPKPQYASRLLSRQHRRIMQQGPGAFGFILVDQVAEQAVKEEARKESSDRKDLERLDDLEELEAQEEVEAQEEWDEELRQRQKDLEAEQRQAEEEGEWIFFGPGF